MITSRDTGRWVIPKGWPMPGLSPEAAAAQEAWEEAGVQGMINPLCIGRYGYQKCLSADASVPCAVAVYGLRVEDLAKTFPEVKERRRKWFPLAEAATLVAEPDRPVRRVALCTGGAQGYFEAAIAAGADAFITGEISEPQAHYARECGVAYLACGHHATERYGAPAVAGHVAQALGLEHRFIDIPNPA